MREQPILQDAFGAQFVAPMNERHLAGEIGEEQRFLDGRIAAADHDHLAVAIEEPIAGCASRNAETLEMLLRGNAQPLGLRARADDQRIAGVDLARIALEPEGALAKPDLGNVVGDDLGPDMGRLRLHLLHEPRALDDIGKTWIILDIGRDGELAAGLDALNQQRFQHRARGINGRRISRRPRPQDQDADMTGLHENLQFAIGDNIAHFGPFSRSAP